MSNPFVLKKFQEDNLIVICLEGYLDFHTAPEFEDTIQAEIDAGRKQIIVDCQKLEYVSSAGLGVFMGFVEELRELGGDIKVCGLTSKVKDVFEMLGFGEIFDIFDGIAAARGSFAFESRTGG
jgi:anti-sigma B factor antagonist